MIFLHRCVPRYGLYNDPFYIFFSKSTSLLEFLCQRRSPKYYFDGKKWLAFSKTFPKIVDF